MNLLDLLKRQPLYVLPVAVLLVLLIHWVISVADPVGPAGPDLTKAERRHYQRLSEQLAAQAAADTLGFTPALKASAAHYATANQLLHAPLPLDSAARLHRLDSLLAAWR